MFKYYLSVRKNLRRVSIAWVLLSGMLAVFARSEEVSIPTVKDETITEYVRAVKASGVLVVVDGFQRKEVGERLIGNSEHVQSNFYQILWRDGICYVVPKDSDMRSAFLKNRIDLLSLHKINCRDAVQALAKEGKADICLWEEHPSDKIVDLDIKDKSVEGALVKMAQAFGAKEIMLLPAMDSGGKRLPYATCVSFGW